MKRFVIGDIHGRFSALKNVLKQSCFNYDEDKLILLGDIVDGGYNTFECVEELLKIKNLVFVIGNHDVWWMNHISSGWAEEIWIQQGGANTLQSYGANVIEAKNFSDTSLVSTRDMNIPVTHQDFFNRAIPYHIEDNMIFVHGGFDPSKSIEEHDLHTLTWDRDLILHFIQGWTTKYDKVFIGHTTTQSHGSLEPIHAGELWMLDTGAGWNGKLTIMDIDTEQYWQSDIQNGGRK